MRRIHELVQIIFTFNQNLFMLTQVFASAVFGIDADPSQSKYILTQALATIWWDCPIMQ